MKRYILVVLVSFFVLLTFGACKTESSDNSSGKAITLFLVNIQGGQYSALFKGNNGTLTVPDGADVTALVPTITTSPDSSISPASGVVQDFTNPVIYTVTAEDSSTQDYVISVVGSKEINAIVKGANRLEDIQNSDGTWEWNNPDTDKTNGPGPSNTYGVTGIGLLGAYEVTKNVTYLDAAKITGDALITKFFGSNSINADNVNDSLRGNAFDIVFFYELGKLSGVTVYTYAANALLENTFYQENYWTTHNGNYCGTDGCTPQELYDAVDDYRTGNPALEFWDLHTYVEASELGGYDFVGELKSVIESEYTTNLNSSDQYYILALAGIVDATGNNDAVAELLALQKPDGRWSSSNPEGDVQDTAYAVMALMKENYAINYNAVTAGVEWLRDNQGTTGGWENDSDTENTELTSEALWSISDYIQNNK
ncbi:MAG: hypothetical protein OQK82_03960 [Candidatus Pacearchaeota archaeon]|nr:hypothetical protein [Candidatus Pacearchaeota archaeon]